jgi:hypothetical protein
MFGKWLVEDDLHDVGLFDYYDREGHRDHPSQFHHWQWGLIMWMIGEFGTVLDFFVPLDEQIAKQQVKKLMLKYAKQKNAQKNF